MTRSTGYAKRARAVLCLLTAASAASAQPTYPTHVIRIPGMSEAEGDALLAELYWYMLQPNAEYRHKWHAGDIVIWDNRCTVHSAAGGYPSSEPRVHWRTTVMQ